MQADGGEALRKAVVDLSRKAIALFHHERELRFEAPDPQVVQSARHEHERHHDQCAEPARLIEMRRHADIERRPRFIPDSIVIGGTYPKAILPGWDTAVRRHSSSPCVRPSGLESLEPVCETDLRRGEQAERR